MEAVDIYDRNGRPTGEVCCRGDRMKPGRYQLMVCVWVSDGSRFLVTQRDPSKGASGLYWENSGGAARAGETSREAIARELLEETGLRAEPGDFVWLTDDIAGDYLFHFYYLEHPLELSRIVLQAGETIDARLVTLEEMDAMARDGRFARPIALHYLQQRPMLLKVMGKKS